MAYSEYPKWVYPGDDVSAGVIVGNADEEDAVLRPKKKRKTAEAPSEPESAQPDAPKE